MDSYERIRLISEIIRHATALIFAASAPAVSFDDRGSPTRRRRTMVEIAMMLAVESGDDVEAWLAEIRERASR
jgi:hypothetical protein